ncbi:rhodanese-like domain-containing protein [Streptomyces sp. NPDC088812]|uniref:sulfurtransferase n=1 Tax=Streptomyces sp. NPDC088812 TaxID=3365905 RepID=UPI00382E6303
MAEERGTDRTQVLVTPEELAAATPPGGHRLIVDATVLLAPPRHDGDYRAESGRSAWREARLPGSLHVDLLTRFTDPAAPFHFAAPGPAAVHRELASLGAGPATELVVYDAGSMQWATRLWWTLRNAGVAARVLDGGLARWRRLGLPVESGDATPARPTAPCPTTADPITADPITADPITADPITADPITARPTTADPITADPTAARPTTAGPRLAHADAEALAVRPPGRHAPDAWPERGRDLWADRRLVHDISLGRRPGTLVCALGREHFEGTAPTRYTRRGRIPRSVSLPARGVLSEHGDVVPDRLLNAYAAGLPADATRPVVVYCGGGISATLAALGLTLAGVEDVRVYDGSLEEWTADRTLPVLTG